MAAGIEHYHGGETYSITSSARARSAGCFLERFSFECARAQSPFGRSDGVAGGHPKAIIDITGPLGISVRDHIIRPQERACQHELV
jgi:hypothetical protein